MLPARSSRRATRPTRRTFLARRDRRTQRSRHDQTGLWRPAAHRLTMARISRMRSADHQRVQRVVAAASENASGRRATQLAETTGSRAWPVWGKEAIAPASGARPRNGPAVRQTVVAAVSVMSHPVTSRTRNASLERKGSSAVTAEPGAGSAVLARPASRSGLTRADSVKRTTAARPRTALAVASATCARRATRPLPVGTVARHARAAATAVSVNPATARAVLRSSRLAGTTDCDHAVVACTCFARDERRRGGLR